MKKLLVVLLCIVMCFSLISCSSSTDNTATDSPVTDNSVIDNSTVEECDHSYIPATCTSPETCKKCGAIKGNALGHTVTNGKCTRCNQYIGVSVKYISNRYIQYDEDKECFYFIFSLLDGEENEVKVAAEVEIRMENDSGEVVYNKTKTVKETDYSTWGNGYSKWIAASIYIYNSEITKGTSSSGTFYYKVTAADGATFDEYSLEINDNLPIKETYIILPSLPTTINKLSYKNIPSTTVKITAITYEIFSNKIILYFTGTKTYDKSGNDYSRICAVGYKIYDSEGYVVETGTYYTDQIKVGDEFRDDAEPIFFDVLPGETYTIELIDAT